MKDIQYHIDKLNHLKIYMDMIIQYPIKTFCGHHLNPFTDKYRPIIFKNFDEFLKRVDFYTLDVYFELIGKKYPKKNILPIK